MPNKEEVETEALAYALTQLSIFEDRAHATELLIECTLGFVSPPSVAQIRKWLT